MQDVLFEGLEGQGRHGLDDGRHRVAVGADLVLGVPVDPQPEEVKEIVEVDLPVHLGVEAQGEVDAGELPGYLVFEQLLVVVVDELLVLLEHADDLLLQLSGHLVVAATLPVAAALLPHLVAARQVELVAHDAVAAADLVQACGAVADPLAGHEDRHLDVEGEDHLLEGAGVTVPEQVVDERPVFADGFGPVAVRDAGGLDDAGVAAEVVDEAHEAVVEDLKLLVEQRFGFGDCDVGHRTVL